MSKGHSEGNPEDGRATPAEPEESPPPPVVAARPHSGSWRTALWLAGMLILVVAGVALFPFWAPHTAPLLPWGEKLTISARDYAALDARLAAFEKRPASPGPDVDAIKSAESALGRRVDQLESAVNARLAAVEKHPAAPSLDVDEMKSAEATLGQRIDQLEASRSAGRQTEAAELQRMQQELTRLGSVTADLVNRLPALEHQVQSQAGAGHTEAALTLVLLQMREAVEQARPFPAEYSAFKALARDPDLAAAAEPLAEAARNGVASRSVLSKRLAELAGPIATATEPPAEADWGTQVLARLRGLVTIRRIDGAPQTVSEAAVSTAETALSRGDLADAVSALDTLGGANAEAVRPWLRMARERLTVEASLDHLRQLLATRLGSRSAAPAEPSAKVKAPL